MLSKRRAGREVAMEAMSGRERAGERGEGGSRGRGVEGGGGRARHGTLRH